MSYNVSLSILPDNDNNYDSIYVDLVLDTIPVAGDQIVFAEWNGLCNENTVSRNVLKILVNTGKEVIYYDSESGLNKAWSYLYRKAFRVKGGRVFDLDNQVKLYCETC